MMKNILPAVLGFTLVCIFTGCRSGSQKSEETKNAVVLTVDNFEKEAGNGVVMIDFWASWCRPCREFAPVIENIADQTAGKAKVGKVDVDAQEELSFRFGIHSIPTVLILKDGAEVERFIGIQSQDVLIKALGRYVEF